MKESNLLPRSTYSMPVSVRLMCFNMAPNHLHWVREFRSSRVLRYIPPTRNRMRARPLSQAVYSQLPYSNTLQVSVLPTTADICLGTRVCLNMAAVPKRRSYCLPCAKTKSPNTFGRLPLGYSVLYHRRHPLIHFFTLVRITQ